MSLSGDATSSRMNSFHKDLRRLRKSKGLTQRQLADLLQSDQTTISLFELGKRDPPADTMEAWVRICGGRIEIHHPGEMALSEVPTDQLPEIMSLIRAYLRAPTHLRQGVQILLQSVVSQNA